MRRSLLQGLTAYGILSLTLLAWAAGTVSAASVIQRFTDDSGNESGRVLDDNSLEIDLIKIDSATINGVAYTFPQADGSDGQKLTTDGSGALTWESAGSGGHTIGTSSGTPGAPTVDLAERTNLTFSTSVFVVTDDPSGDATIIGFANVLIPKAHVVFTDPTTIDYSVNVSSIAKIGTGSYDVFITDDCSNTDSMVVQCTSNQAFGICRITRSLNTVTKVRVEFQNGSSTNIIAGKLAVTIYCE